MPRLLPSKGKRDGGAFPCPVSLDTSQPFLGIPSGGNQRFLGLFGHILKIEIPLDLFLAQLNAGFYVTRVHDLCDSLIVMLAGILVVTGCAMKYSFVVNSSAMTSLSFFNTCSMSIRRRE